MDFSLAEEHVMLKTSARNFLDTECPKRLVREMDDDATGYSPELWKKMAGLGWQGLVIPEEYGGGGSGFIDLVVLLRGDGPGTGARSVRADGGACRATHPGRRQR